MGYYTRHTLTIVEGDDHETDHEKGIAESNDYMGCFDEEIKWYDHEEDMRKYSKKYPDVLFKIEGEGEESGDLWVEYHKNGRMQRCKGKITFDEYDPKLLE